MEKAINALMLQGGRERKAAGEGERTSGEGRVKIQIKCIRILPPPPKKGSLFPKIDQRRKKHRRRKTRKWESQKGNAKETSGGEDVRDEE